MERNSAMVFIDRGTVYCNNKVLWSVKKKKISSLCVKTVQVMHGEARTSVKIVYRRTEDFSVFAEERRLLPVFVFTGNG